jgi:hypothetical protein
VLSPVDPDARHIVTRIVRAIAAETGLTTLLRIGDSPFGPFAVMEQFLHQPDPDFGLLLNAAAAAESADPLGFPISACALLLPDRDLAYIKHGTAPMTTLTIGRNPIDDPDTHQGVEAGLEALTQAIGQTEPPTRPTGRPFPSATPDRPPNTSARFGPTSTWTPPPPGPDRPRPHR